MSSHKARLVESVGVAESGNMLIHGDCLASSSFLKELIDAGRMPPVDLVYIDPPFASGLVYGTQAYLRPHPTEGSRPASMQETRALDVPIFSDVWERGDWCSWARENLLAIRQVMSPCASLYVQQDYHSSAHMRLLLDEVFGEDAFRSEIIWVRHGLDLGDTSFENAHETILHYALSSNSVFSAAAASATDVWSDIEGLYDVNPAQGNYATQKPEGLLERIIRASSEEGMLVADFFGGSGVCAAVAARLGRSFVHADMSVRSVQTARQRLLEIGNLSFDVFEAEGMSTPCGLGPVTEECNGDDMTFTVEQIERAGQMVWRTTMLRSRFGALERDILDANVNQHMACLFSGGELPEPLRVSDTGLELVECVSLDCSAAEGTWHADAEVYIDRAGLVIKGGRATGQRWDACVYSNLPPRRVRVRSIRGDEVVRPVNGKTLR